MVVLAQGGRIAAPGGAAPVVILQDQSFQIQYTAKDGATGAELVGPWSRFPLQLTHFQNGPILFDRYARDTVLFACQATLPSGVPEELFTLRLFCGAETLQSPGAVKVLRAWPSRLTLLHITDAHVTADYDTAAHVARELAHVAPIVRVANILGLDMVMCTGDAIMDYTLDGYPTLPEKWNQFWNGAGPFCGWRSLNVPMVLCAGNHDAQWAPYPWLRARQWSQQVGQRTFGLAYGSTRFLIADVSLGTDDTLSQRLALARWLDSVGMGAVRILAVHEPGKVDGAYTETLKPRYALTGHTHRNTITEVGTLPTKVIETGSAGHFSYVGTANVGWMRLLTFRDSTLLVQSLFQYGNTATLQEALTLTFVGKNDGTRMSNRAVVRNRLSGNLPPCRVRFVMRKGIYLFSKGTVVQQYDNDTATVVDITVPVAMNDSAVIQVTPSPQAVERSMGAPSPVLTIRPLTSSTGVLFSYRLATKGRLQLFSSSGEKVFATTLAQGEGRLIWNGRDNRGRPLASGCFGGRMEMEGAAPRFFKCLLLR